MSPIRVGKPDVDPSLMSHTAGTNQGNAKGNYEKQSGWLPDGRVTAARSTGVNSSGREPIDKRMPNLPPG